ncbi:hypothetical protein Tco_1221095 [Tanacetum coccineum]
MFLDGCSDGFGGVCVVGSEINEAVWMCPLGDSRGSSDGGGRWAAVAAWVMKWVDVEDDECGGCRLKNNIIMMGCFFKRERIKELELRTQQRNNFEEEFFKDMFPNKKELAYHKELLGEPHPPFSTLEPKIKRGDHWSLKIPCVIGAVYTRHAYIDLQSPVNIMFARRDDEVMFSMPQRTKELDLVSPLEKDKFEAFFVESLKVRKKGFKHVIEKRKGYYKACINLGRTYKKDRETIEKLKTNHVIFDEKKLGIPTGRVVVPTGRYVVPAGKVIIIVSPGRLNLVPTGRILSPGSDNDSDDASIHSEATIPQQQRNIQPQIITTVSNNNAKFPYLRGESKARTTLLQSIPDDHVADFHYMDDARDIWNAVKARFGGNAESKKMRKSMLKQEFSEFRIGDAGEFALMGVTSEVHNCPFGCDNKYNELQK